MPGHSRIDLLDVTIVLPRSTFAAVADDLEEQVRIPAIKGLKAQVSKR